MFIQGLKTLLGVMAPELELDTAADIDDAVGLATANSYDLILLDWHLRDCEGPEAITRLRGAGSLARVVVLSGETDTALIRRSVDHGAAGFIPKRYSSESMLAALKIVVSGGIYLPGEALRDSAAPRRTVPGPADAALIDIAARYRELTPRQVDVYRAAARGLSNKLIARELGIAESTVKTHLSTVFAVLGVSNRTQAAYQASREGFRVA
jgi:DNA-binding NarL/FixJ family response regulator